MTQQSHANQPQDAGVEAENASGGSKPKPENVAACTHAAAETRGDPFSISMYGFLAGIAWERERTAAELATLRAMKQRAEEMLSMANAGFASPYRGLSARYILEGDK